MRDDVISFPVKCLVSERLESLNHGVRDLFGCQFVRLETQSVRQEEFTTRDTFQVRIQNHNVVTLGIDLQVPTPTNVMFFDERRKRSTFG
jgi:hypothetical protein